MAMLPALKTSALNPQIGTVPLLNASNYSIPNVLPYGLSPVSLVLNAPVAPPNPTHGHAFYSS